MTVAALNIVAPTPTVFFATQLAFFYLEVTVLVAAMCGSLPAAPRRGRVRPAASRPTLASSPGSASTMLLLLGLTSIDQVFLSATLPLAEFGYYTLAVSRPRRDAGDAGCH